jgi:putative transposase
MQNSKTRKQNRLKGYDYSADGYYFVTVCTNNRQALFGTIENIQIVLNKAGEMIQFWWSEIPIHFSGITLDKYIIMPNHIHGIIIVQWYKTMTTNQYIQNVKNNNWSPLN